MDGLAEDESCRFRPPKSVQEEDSLLVQPKPQKPKSTQYKDNLEEKLEDLDSLSLNYWLTKFVQEVANKNGDRYPSRSLYGIVCGLERYLEDVNGGNVLNPLDSSHKR
ncbi:unnamed protein product [Porites lobata]|uniref:QRICH1-like domain-containing protein n=1 Tax=Porites lobata TaxID=104759 RepID=A0ABN8RNL4_9CNID|nr:unnamed protein product [Porites lobata]